MITKVGVGHDGTWSSKATHTLTNPKAGLNARARIQVYDAANMSWGDVAGAVDYEEIPIPKQKDEEPEPLVPSIEEYAVSQFSSRRGARDTRVVVAGDEERA